MNPIETFFHDIPKPELHVHVRGAIPIAIFTKLLNHYVKQKIWLGWPKPTLDLFTHHPNISRLLNAREWTEQDVEALFEFQSFPQFLTAFCFTGYFIRTVEDLDLLITGVIAALAAQNINYVELTISLPEYVRPGLDLKAILSCMAKASNQQVVKISWIADLVRDYGPEQAYHLLEEALSLNSSIIKGITLGGSEHLFPQKSFTKACRLALDHGLRLTIHAGEGAGAESVWSAIDDLGAERIGHGVRSIEDPRLVAYLADQRIPLELCPTSNVRTGVFKSYRDLPIKSLFDAGVIVTLNTDDPTFFQTSLAREYALMADLGLTKAELMIILENGYRAAFLPQAEIDSLVEQLQQHPGLRS